MKEHNKATSWAIYTRIKRLRRKYKRLKHKIERRQEKNEIRKASI
jgi:hypothetical protein